MRNANYRQIPALLSNRVPFTGNSSSARIDGQGNYHVYSYETLIATWHATGVTWLDARKYSTTTSRLQNIIKRAWDL